MFELGVIFRLIRRCLSLFAYLVIGIYLHVWPSKH